MTVEIERRDRVAIVRFDRGDGANALSSPLMEELADAARALDRDDDLTAVVLAGGAPNFSLGYDLAEAQARRDAPPGLTALRRAARVGRDMCRAWAEMEPMTFAAVEGWCVGGGGALAAHCDLRVFGAGARFYLPEVERGLNMSWGSIPRIAALVGPARTKRLAALAEKADAATALDWGLADRLADEGGALATALAWAGEAAALPPVQVRMIKAQVDAAAHPLAGATSALDRDQFVLAAMSEDHAESVAAFLGRRAPRYTGR